MFGVGDKVIYGITGVCQVDEKYERGGRQFYVLKPLFQTCRITTPVDNAKVIMRPVISREEALKVIRAIPSTAPETYVNSNVTQLKMHYNDIIALCDCMELMKLLISIQDKKRMVESQNRKFGTIDQMYMKRAEDLLFGELSVALDIPKDSVGEFIEKTLSENG